MNRHLMLFGLMAALLLATGFLQSWNNALAIVNMCLISAIMALGVNLQWGYAGLLNFGIMGLSAIGGLAVVLVASQPVAAAWHAGGGGILLSALIIGSTAAALIVIKHAVKPPRLRLLGITVTTLSGLFLLIVVYFPAREAIEAVDPTKTGFLGGVGLPIIVSWLFGALLAAGVAWLVGKVSLGLRSDYLAIATLGISEIIIAVLKNEEWLSRGVKNVSSLPRPVPYEVDLQQSEGFIALAERLGFGGVEFSAIIVKLCYAGLFSIVLLVLLWFAERLLRSPWGRMMRAIRDNETAARAMGKNVTARHLYLFVIGSGVVGMAGAMMTTLDGQFVPGTYNPLRFTFVIWVMVIAGGSGNNFGSILGGFLVWFFWVQSEPIGRGLLELLTIGFDEQSPIREHLLKNAAQARLVMMGLTLLLITRYAPKGLIPEETFRR
ncbi:MAG: branched-chain amino acid ABC transporter permease [Alphaproteobacteria bacterium]|nr:branched-chain amino acid ABC transporter permease [Alphaproteobacteria bacterium]